MLVTESGNSTVSWQVVDNGLDFLDRAVSEMAGPAPDHKYAALHLFCAIEVLIKARLMREHWTLVASKLEGATPAKLETGELLTVDPMAGLKRLQDIAGISVSQTHSNAVDAVRKLRNRVAHFAFVGADPLADAVTLSKGLDFAWWLLAHHIGPGAPDAEAKAIQESLEKLAQESGTIASLVKTRLAEIQGDLGSAELLLGCPRCSQGTLSVVEGDSPTCLFCHWTSSGSDSADQYVSDVLGVSSYEVYTHGGEWPVLQCPDCEVEALVHGAEPVNLSAGHEFICFACGLLADHIETCGRCGVPCHGSICDECLHNLMRE